MVCVSKPYIKLCFSLLCGWMAEHFVVVDGHNIWEAIIYLQPEAATISCILWPQHLTYKTEALLCCYNDLTILTIKLGTPIVPS